MNCSQIFLHNFFSQRNPKMINDRLQRVDDKNHHCNLDLIRTFSDVKRSELFAEKLHNTR